MVVTILSCLSLIAFLELIPKVRLIVSVLNDLKKKKKHILKKFNILEQ